MEAFLAKAREYLGAAWLWVADHPKLGWFIIGAVAGAVLF